MKKFSNETSQSCLTKTVKTFLTWVWYTLNISSTNRKSIFSKPAEKVSPHKCKYSYLIKNKYNIGNFMSLPSPMSIRSSSEAFCSFFFASVKEITGYHYHINHKSVLFYGNHNLTLQQQQPFVTI